MQLNHIVKKSANNGIIHHQFFATPGKDYESPLPARTDAR